MATSLGKSGYFRLSATTATELRNYALTRSTDTVDDTVIGDAWKTNKSTLKSWNVSGALFWDPLDPAQVSAAAGIETDTAITVDLYPMGTATAATYYSGLALVTELGVAASHDGMVERSFSCIGTGALSTLTV